MTDSKITAVKLARHETYYNYWVKEVERIPVVKGYYIEDLRKVPVEPWKRKGGKGAYINLEGAEGFNDAYVAEIPPGGSLNPEKHAFEEFIFIVAGRGASTIWQPDGQKQTFEWQEGSLFSPPLNAWHQEFNGSGDKPARYMAVTLAPIVLNIYRNHDFVFNSDYIFRERYSGEPDFFSAKGKSAPGRIWESNFIPDTRAFKLQEWKERGAGGSNIEFEIANNSMVTHISEFPVGTYKKAHKHGPGAHVVLLNGTGYSLLWPLGSPRKKVDWQNYSMFVPPDQWFHQHFNTGKDPARYLALRLGGRLGGNKAANVSSQSVKLGGNQIEYEDEDPEIGKLFKNELAKNGAPWKMEKFFPNA